MGSQDTLTVNGVRSPLIDLGPRSGEASVFVHRNPGSRLDWEELAGQVSAFARAVALDMPGFAGLRRASLVIWGARDPYVSVRYAEHQREVFPNAQIVVPDDSGPWPFADDLAAVGRAIIPFLRRQIGAGVAA